MPEYFNERFESLSFTGNDTYDSLTFTKCDFQSCGFAARCRPNGRTTVRNSVFKDCKQSALYLGPGVVENTLIDNLRSSSFVIANGTAFRQVTLKKSMGRIMFRNYFSLSDPGLTAKFERANAEFYKSVDWALDISEAEFVDCDIRDIPPELIVRDPETQFIITREKALEREWEKLDLSGTHWPLSIKWLISKGHPSDILVAPKKSKKYKHLLEGLIRLRDAGVVS